MAALTALRQQAVTALKAAGLNAVEYTSERLVAPVAVVAPDHPYVDHEDVTFGHIGVNLNVLLIAAKGTNKAAADAVDQLIEDALVALDDADFDVREVSEPGEINLNGQSHLGAVINVKQETKIGGQ